MKNFYEVLRVRTNATQAQIKKAFLYLVSKYHPDVYTGDKLYAERYTALLTEAYSVLKDPERRFDYDMRHNINTRPSSSQLRREDRAIRQEQREERRMSGKNYEQENIGWCNAVFRRTGRNGLLRFCDWGGNVND